MEMLVKDFPIILSLTILFFLSIWAIDVSVSTINVNCYVSKNPNNPFNLSGLIFRGIDVVTVYHVSIAILMFLWVIFIIFFFYRCWVAGNPKEVTL
jgi:hypothetical protein